MEKILLKLNPYIADEDIILFNELDEVGQIIFISSGKVDIGFQVNSKLRFIVRFSDTFMVGAYHCTYQKRTIAIYKTYTPC